VEGFFWRRGTAQLATPLLFEKAKASSDTSLLLWALQALGRCICAGCRWDNRIAAFLAVEGRQKSTSYQVVRAPVRLAVGS
jgi:hypothetical protein